MGSGWEREGLEMGEVGGVDNGWKVQWVGGGKNREKKIKHSHYLLKKALRHWYNECMWLCKLDNMHMTLLLHHIM